MGPFSKRSKFFKCFITHITATKNEIEIWCQTDTKLTSCVETGMNAVHNQLSDIFAINSQNLRPIATPEVGQNYLTHMKDLHFHRVVVTHVEEESSRASVLFIDFGVEDCVPFNQLVEFNDLFEIKPLAQKYFLADIHTKDSEWNTEEVKRCLQPYLMDVFQCEVISIEKNTEFIRVYDQFFNQPLVQSLVKHCNAFLTYPSYGKEIFEAIDLSIDKRVEVNSVDVDLNGLNGSPNKSETELKSITAESSPKQRECENNQIEELFIENKENVCPTVCSPESQTNEKINTLEDKEVESVVEDKHEEEVIVKESPKKVNESQEISNETNGQQLIDESPQSPQINGERSVSIALNDTSINEDIHEDGVDSGIANITHELELKPKEITNDSHKISSEEIKEEVLDKSTEQEEEEEECNSKEQTVDPKPTVEEVKETKCNDSPVSKVDSKPTVEEVKETKCNGSPVSDIDSGNVCVDSSPKATNVEVNQKQSAKESEDIDLCPNREFIGKKYSIYLTTNIFGKFYAQLSTQFDVIQGLTERMTEFYTKIYGSDKYGLNLNSIKTNDIIAARFSGDSLWYRASVKSNSGKYLDLIYIDFGNEESVEVKECKQLTEEFNIKDLKAQALLCQPITGKLESQTVDKYINDMNEVEVEFVDFTNDCFKIKILSVK